MSEENKIDEMFAWVGRILKALRAGLKVEKYHESDLGTFYIIDQARFDAHIEPKDAGVISDALCYMDEYGLVEEDEEDGSYWERHTYRITDFGRNFLASGVLSRGPLLRDQYDDLQKRVREISRTADKDIAAVKESYQKMMNKQAKESPELLDNDEGNAL